MQSCTFPEMNMWWMYNYINENSFIYLAYNRLLSEVRKVSKVVLCRAAWAARCHIKLVSSIHGSVNAVSSSLNCAVLSCTNRRQLSDSRSPLHDSCGWKKPSHMSGVGNIYLWRSEMGARDLSRHFFGTGIFCCIFWVLQIYFFVVDAGAQKCFRSLNWAYFVEIHNCV